MKNNKASFTLTALAAAIMAVSTNYAMAIEIADDEDFEDYEPELDELIIPISSVSVGIGHWGGEREQFGIFDDIRDDETILLLDADIRRRDDETGTWLTGKVRDLGLDTRELELGYERQGDWKIGVSYDAMTRSAPYTVNTALAGLGSDNQTITTIAPGTGRDVVLNTERHKLGFNGFKYLTDELRLKVDFKTEEKEGDRHWGFRRDQPEFIVEPIDSTTRQLEAVLEYSGKQFQLNGGYYGSWYESDHSQLSVVDDAGPNFPTIMSLPLDNQAHQLFLNGGYSFTRSTRGTFKLAYTHATSDDPATLNNMDAEVNTTLASVGLTSRPMKNLSLVAKLRYHEVDDKTNALLVAPSEPVNIKPNDYRKITGKLEGTYRLPRGYSLTAGIDYSDKDRDKPLDLGNDIVIPYADNLDETTYRIRLRKAMSETLNGSIEYAHSQRDHSSYTPTNVNTAVTGLSNPIHLIDRDRDKWRVSLDWTPMDNLGLQFNFEDSDDDYESTRLGLESGSARLFSVDADYAINDDWRLTGWASWDEAKANQNYLIDPDHWSWSDLKDTGVSVGLGLDGNLNIRTKVGGNLEWTETKSEFDDHLGMTTTYSAPNVPLTDIKSTAFRLELFAEYRLTLQSDLRLNLIHERWKTDDWAWTFADGSPFIYGDGDDGTMVVNDDNQSATFVGVSYRHKF